MFGLTPEALTDSEIGIIIPPKAETFGTISYPFCNSKSCCLINPLEPLPIISQIGIEQITSFCNLANILVLFINMLKSNT